ncbi:hypothetical protein HYQ46_004992 [Verticillium longisporum]|nr:hypothetical protein HYQ46_004992 [Verticillium longisporum]
MTGAAVDATRFLTCCYWVGMAYFSDLHTSASDEDFLSPFSYLRFAIHRRTKRATRSNCNFNDFLRQEKPA